MSLYRKIVYKNGERLNELSIQLIKSLLFRRCPMVFFKEIMSALCQTADFPLIFPNKPSSNPNLKVTVLLDLLGFSPLLPHKASGPEPYVPQSLAEVSYL